MHAAVPPWRRRRHLALATACLLILAGVAALPGTRQAYHRWRADLFLARAGELLAQRRTGEASLLVQNALRHAPQSAAAWTTHAAVLEQWGSPQRAAALARAWSLDRSNAALAAAALQACVTLRDETATRFLLAQAAPAFPNDARVQHLAGLCCAVTGREEDAGRHFASAARLAPDDTAIRLSRATLQVFAPSTSERNAALADLPELTRHADTRPAALALIAAVTSTRDPDQGLALWDSVIAADDTALTPHLHRLAVLQRIHPDQVPAQLTRLVPRATNTPDAVALADAALGLGLPMVADRVLSKVRPDDQWQRNVMELRWETYALTGQWRRLLDEAAPREAALTQPEAQALSALWQYRAQSALGQASLSSALLARLLGLLASQPDAALMAGRRLWRWHLTDAALAALEPATRGNPLCRQAAWSDRLRLAKQLRRTPAAHEAAEALLALEPAHPARQGDVAFFLALQRTDLPRARALVEQALARRPNDAQLLATHARLDFLAGRTSDALATYAALPGHVAALPTIRLHHAETLAAAHRDPEARALAAGLHPHQLFPEDAATLARLQPPP